MLLRWLIISVSFYAASSVAQSQNVFNPQAITVAIDKTPVSFNPYSDHALMEKQFKHLLFDPLFRWEQSKNRAAFGEKLEASR